MTDDQLDELLRGAYAEVELSAEAEDRILANLLAAEQRMEEEERSEKPVRTAHRRTSGWRWVAPAAVAAVLLIGVFVGTQMRPSFSTSDGMAPRSAEKASESVAEEADFDMDAGGGVMGMNSVEESALEPEPAPVPEPEPAPAPEPESKQMEAAETERYAVTEGGMEDSYDSYAEVIVLADGRRFAIIDVFVHDEIDPGELDWLSATLEETGDPCEAALLDDGTCVVLFEDIDVLYLATPL